MISALTWVSRGKLKTHPDRYQITDEDIRRLKSQVQDDDEDDLTPSIDEKKVDEALAKMYSTKTSKVHEGEADMEEEDEEEFSVHPDEVAPDPYLPEEEDDLEEIDDETIRPTDGIIVAAVAKSEEDEEVSRLEVHIYEEGDKNLYLHHDILLGSFPLAVTYLDCNGTNTPGNYAAVGSFEPAIEIWNLDTIDIMEPEVVLGGYDSAIVGKKNKKKHLPGSHTGAVMCLSWNQLARNILASGSADATVKLWDLNTKQCASTLSHHKKEVQSVEWHPTESSIMLTGSFDKTIQLLDVRSNDKSSYLTWTIPHDCECIQWNPSNPQYFVVGTENGSLYYYDVMKGSKSAPVWTLNAHSKAASCVAINRYVPLLATGSVSKAVKLFDISGAVPQIVDTINWHTGVFSVSFYNDSPNLMAIGGETSGLRVLDLTNNKNVVEKYMNKQDGNSKATTGDADMMDDDSTTPQATTITTTNPDKKKKKKKNKSKKNK